MRSINDSNSNVLDFEFHLYVLFCKTNRILMVNLQNMLTNKSLWGELEQPDPNQSEGVNLSSPEKEILCRIPRPLVLGKYSILLLY